MAALKGAPRYQPGDRVRVRKNVTTPSVRPDDVGVVREVVPCYADKTTGYNLSLDNDPRPSRTWFFFEEQLTAAERCGKRERS